MEFEAEEVKMIMEQANCDEITAKRALDKTDNNLAKAILMITNG